MPRHRLPAFALLLVLLATLAAPLSAAAAPSTVPTAPSLIDWFFNWWTGGDTTVGIAKGAAEGHPEIDTNGDAGVVLPGSEQTTTDTEEPVEGEGHPTIDPNG